LLANIYYCKVNYILLKKYISCQCFFWKFLQNFVVNFNLQKIVTHLFIKIFCTRFLSNTHIFILLYSHTYKTIFFKKKMHAKIHTTPICTEGDDRHILLNLNILILLNLIEIIFKIFNCIFDMIIFLLKFNNKLHKISLL